jgi:hypothetical protein
MSTFRNLIKLAAFGAVVYGAYKYGKSVGDKESKIENPPTEPNSPPFQEIDQTESEERYLVELIEELRQKPHKTQKDRYNIELLEVKLKQIRNKR